MLQLSVLSVGVLTRAAVAWMCEGKALGLELWLEGGSGTTV